MVTALLFKEECSADGSRVVRFWIHQPNRLTDGHIAIGQDGKARTSVNMSSKGKRAAIEARADYDGSMRRKAGGFEEWDDARLAALLDDLQVEAGNRPHADAFAEAIVMPIRAVESAMAEHLAIKWDVRDEDISDAIGLRYHVVQKAEAILNDAGLLVDQMGTVVADDQVSATIEVTQFAAAKTLLMSALSAEERRYNCQILHV